MKAENVDQIASIVINDKGFVTNYSLGGRLLQLLFKSDHFTS